MFHVHLCKLGLDHTSDCGLYWFILNILSAALPAAETSWQEKGFLSTVCCLKWNNFVDWTQFLGTSLWKFLPTACELRAGKALLVPLNSTEEHGWNRIDIYSSIAMLCIHLWVTNVRVFFYACQMLKKIIEIFGHLTAKLYTSFLDLQALAKINKWEVPFSAMHFVLQSKVLD